MMATSEPWITLKRDYEAAHKTINDPAKEVLIADVQGQPIGFVIINMQGPFVAYIQTVCITPRYRNQGIGRVLIEFAEKRIFTDAPNVFICVSSFNTRARTLYERLGYFVVGELKDFVVTGHSEILLRKTISSLRDFNAKSV